MKWFAQDLSEYEIVHILRFGPETDDPDADWVYSCVCASKDGYSATLMAFKSDPDFTLSTAYLAVRAAHKLGYKRVTWERKNHGKNRTVDATRKSGSDIP